MSGHSLVIVESPAKAKTINKYLGSDYTVLASYGHIRDLPSKDGSVSPDEGFSMRWELSDRANKPLSEIKNALKKADTIYLATDPDREGEAISWHLQEYLNDKKLLKDKTVRRVTFNQITVNAVQEAFAHPREVDNDLVEAYLARRALDYLVGFNISPVLWRKLPGSRSAGRVQSVALRLIAEREAEIEKFTAQEYWSISTVLHTPDGAPFEARLTHLSGNKLDKLDIRNDQDAQAAVKRIEAKKLSVQTIERKQTKRNPYAPFITSTLQQEASRKLGFAVNNTMRTAQKLYEDGLITYMRTDGITLSGEAITQIRKQIDKEYGNTYLPESPRAFKSKAKNAQEAHEAIRPTDISLTPRMVAQRLNESELKLYSLIWKRTMACQMESAILNQMVVTISDGTDDVILRANGSVVTFDGFLKLYEETREDKDESDDENDRRLPSMNENDPLKIHNVLPEQHFTQPPPRYTEASLVKKLEEEGIGRPSTYASIIQVLQDRDYVKLEQKRFIPEDRGRIVTTFLMKYFTRYVDYAFTADLEEQLDAISGGHVAWKEALRLFWKDFSEAVEKTKSLTITEVIDALNEDLTPHFFPVRNDGHDPRACPNCDDGTLGLKLGKFGAFIGCSNYPECNYTRRLEIQNDNGSGDGIDLDSGPVELGHDPDTNRMVTLKKGPYGIYVERAAENPEDKKSKPKRQGLPRGLNASDVTLDIALQLLSLPRLLGHHPEDNEEITAGIGRFGSYLKHGARFVSLKGDDDILTIGMNRAVEVIANTPVKGIHAATAKLRDIGEHPTKKQPLELHTGRYGPYVKMGKIMASLPKGTDAEKLTLEEASMLIDKKQGNGSRKKAAAPGKTGTKKATPKTKKVEQKEKTTKKKS